jgi:hypothetical protein
MTDHDGPGLTGLLRAAGERVAAPPDLFDQVQAAATRRRLRRRRSALGSALAALLVVVAGTGWALQRSGSPGQAGATAVLVPAKGDRIKGSAEQPDAVSGGRLVSATGVLADTGFGLVAPPPELMPRLSAQEAYSALLAPGNGVGGPTSGAGATISLAVATKNAAQQTQNTLVWVFVWTGQTCVAAGPLVPDPTPRPCASWAILDDSTGLLIESGDGTTG